MSSYATNTVILDKTTKALVVGDDDNMVKENQGLHAENIITGSPSTPTTGWASTVTLKVFPQ